MIQNQNETPDAPGLTYKKLNTAWQVTGALLFPILFTLLLILYFTNPHLQIFPWLLWLGLPIIMIHEFEEYVAPGGFKNFFNTKTLLAPTPLKEDVPLNEPYILFMNPILIWPWVTLGALFYTVPWIGISAVFFQLGINNIQHIGLFQVRHKGYNPGLFTTMFLMMPYCTLILWYVLVNPVMTTTDWILSFVVSAGVILTLLSITMTRLKHTSQG